MPANTMIRSNSTMEEELQQKRSDRLMRAQCVIKGFDMNSVAKYKYTAKTVMMTLGNKERDQNLRDNLND